ncbi:MAG: nucleotidyl transferase AbiEii/AbiGii toxin family protein [Candidatus Sabulitectum sp.]|nr:nucleotidyl transferase AbiEii/AbiGii toxin family protein [Candidatus Sabulitectum sp.]
MIPRANITAWRSSAPWPSNDQVEQDLVLSRVLVSLFSSRVVADEAVFRGGTALHKMLFTRPGRYSEDIDLVQRNSGPIGKLITAIRSTLDSWLGDPAWKQGKGRFTLYYAFETSFAPVSTRRVKIEINTREHFTVLGIEMHPYAVVNPWFTGTSNISIYSLEELLGTKLRALYQRRKGRDLYDLWQALSVEEARPDRIIECFQSYISRDGLRVSRAQFEANLASKLLSKAFLDDIRLLIPADIEYNTAIAANIIQDKLLTRLPGNPWKGTASE